LSGHNVEPLPQVQDAPFDRGVPAAEKKMIRKIQGVSIPASDRRGSSRIFASSRKPEQSPKLNSYWENEASRKYFLSA